MPSLSILLALPLLTAVAPPGPASPLPDPREKQARLACAGGDPARGVGLLAELYTETGDANVLYNQGRCYQQNGQPQQALSRFKEFLRLAGPGTPSAHLAKGRASLAEAEAEIAAELRRRPASPPPGELALSVVSPPAPPRRRWLGLVGGVASGAAGLGALALGVSQSRKLTEIEDSIARYVGGTAPREGRTVRAMVADGERTRNRARAAYLVAGVAAVSAVAFLLLGPGPSSGATAEGPQLSAAGDPGAGLRIPF